MVDDELRYKILKILEEDPKISQRALSKRLGISLGKVNYCMQALIEKGLVKARNFSHNDKRVYAYLLTPHGIEEKARVTVRFLRRKLMEYEILRQQVAELRQEVAGLEDTADRDPLPKMHDPLSLTENR
jgi:EPS-associated MarR family transcriptional regulator